MPPEISSGINREDLADRQEEMEKSNESSCVTTTQNDLTSSTPAMFSESETNSKEVSQMRIQVQNSETILVYELMTVLLQRNCTNTPINMGSQRL